MKLNWSVVIAVIAGVAAGVTSSLVTAARNVSQAPPQASQQQASHREYVPILVAPAADPVDEVRARSAQLATAEPQQPRASMGQDQRSEEEQRRATHARHEALVQAHRSEPVDPAWAGKTGAMLKSDLAEVAQSSSFELVEAECRTTSCLATLRWPSFGKAQAEWRKLLHHGYQANCSREITLPEPSDENTPYQATLVLDCEGWRSEGM